MQVLHDADMSTHLWYQLGGKAKYLLKASTRQDIEEALDFISDNAISKIFVCGLGANLIFTDDYFDGAVLQIVSGENKLYDDVSLSRSVADTHFKRNGNVITAFSGEVLDNLVVYALQHNLTGLEWAGGLPGTVGAGIRGNVGAFGGEIKDSVLEAEVIEFGSKDFQIKKMTREELNFTYRTSTVKLHRNLIVLSATFHLNPASPTEVEKARQTYFGNVMYRKTRHPLDHPNCGSVFKNIARKEDVEKVLSIWPDIKETVDTKWHGKVSMGYIIKRLDLSGKKVGKAEISEKHSNFIVNVGGAKAKDVKTLIDEIQSKSQATFGFVPEVEVEIIE